MPHHIQKITMFIGLVGLLSCSKTHNDLGPDYPHLLGKWGNEIGDDQIQIEFKKNGRINLHSSVQRGKSLKAFTYETYASKPQLEAGWHTVTYSQNDKSISVDINSTLDTIAIKTGAIIDGFIYIKSSEKAFLFRQI